MDGSQQGETHSRERGRERPAGSPPPAAGSHQAAEPKPPDSGEDKDQRRLRLTPMPKEMPLDGPEPDDRFGRNLHRAAHHVHTADSRLREARATFKRVQEEFYAEKERKKRLQLADAASDLSSAGLPPDQMKKLADALRAGTIDIKALLGGQE